MRILVTGATGLIGEKLCRELLLKDHDLIIVGRDSEEQFRAHFTLPCEYYNWNEINASNVQAIIHLAGDSIAGNRWTAKKKASILNSRVNTTKKLVEAFSGNWPEVFIGASAIGIYGNRADEILTEDSQPGKGFLPDVCSQWEESAMPFKQHSRFVSLRLGIVLDANGGFLVPMEKLFSMGVGGQIGRGNQWMSWIHIQDVVQMFIHALENPLNGSYNAVAPEPVTNSQWTKAYAKQLGVDAPFATPDFILRAFIGEMSCLATDSQKVSSEKIVSSGFNFQFKDLTSALTHLYSWKTNPSKRIFESLQWISAKREEIFPFFSDAKNLEKITPHWLKFKVLNQSTEKISAGTLIDYKISLKGFPMRWRTEIKNWSPPIEFADEQIKGPYKKWFHTHSFDEYPRGTLMRDRVIYELPFGRFGQLLMGNYVKKDVSQIFSYRKQAIRKLEHLWRKY